MPPRWHDVMMADSRHRSLTVRIPEDQAAALDAVAQVDAIPVAEAVRLAIDEHIDARRQDTEFQDRLREMVERNRAVLDRLAR